MDTEDNGKQVKYECVYSDSGKTPLLCSAVAFVGLAVAMVVLHMYILIAVSKLPAPAVAFVGLAGISWDTDSTRAKTLTWQAGLFFVTTW